jgi:hypothetical protein
MIPEAELVRKEFIVREMDYPASVELTKNSLLRWCCLSLGLISKNESRDKGIIIIDALFTLLFNKKINPTTLDIQEYIKEKTKVEFSEKIIRYHINRLIELNLIERKNNQYFINPAKNSDNRKSLSESYENWVKKEIESELSQTKKAINKLQDLYEKKK